MTVTFAELRRSLPWSAPLALLAVAGGLLAGAFAFEIWGGLKPCTLCLYQRWPHGLVVIFAGLALGARGGAQTLLLVISAISLWTGAAIAGFHVGVEQGWWPGTASCGTTETPGDLKSLMALLEAQPLTRCDEVPWSLFGLSMAAYNFIISLVMGGASWVAAGLIEKDRLSDAHAAP